MAKKKGTAVVAAADVESEINGEEYSKLESELSAAIAELNEIKKKESSLTLVKNPFFSAKQIEFMRRPTPKQYVLKKTGRGGTYDYVPGGYCLLMLNYAVGWNWEFVVLSEKQESGMVVVRGRLTIWNEDGTRSVSREQYGSAEIKLLKDSKNFLNLGNDYKAAATDAFKKCCSMFGIAQDVYNAKVYAITERAKSAVPSAPKEPEFSPYRSQLDGYIAKLRAKGQSDSQIKSRMAQKTGLVISGLNFTEAQSKAIINLLEKK